MEGLLKELDAAFRLMSSVPVVGDDIDKMAAAREHLRNVFNELQKMDAEQKDGGTEVSSDD